MKESIETIELAHLLIAFIPAILVLALMVKWSLAARNAGYALARMLGQLMVIGYFLTYLFEVNHGAVIVGVLTLMVFVSSWIALGTVQTHRRALLLPAIMAIGVGGGATLLLMTTLVLQLDPWYLPNFMIPLAGMVFSNSMNGVSLAGERYFSELERGGSFIEHRNAAFQASMIPVVNSLFAVGLVSIPGMMTGQILSGVEPLIAARYQIMVMCMVFASTGLSSAIFLWVLGRKTKV